MHLCLLPQQSNGVAALDVSWPVVLCLASSQTLTHSLGVRWEEWSLGNFHLEHVRSQSGKGTVTQMTVHSKKLLYTTNQTKIAVFTEH